MLCLFFQGLNGILQELVQAICQSCQSILA